MERLSFNIEFIFAVAVFRVANQRMTDIRHVNTDLVRSAR